MRRRSTPPPLAGWGWGEGWVHRRSGDARTPPPAPHPQGEGEACSLRVLALAAAILLLACLPARAGDEDQDLQFIPPAAQQAQPPAAVAPAATGTQRNYLEDAFQLTALRPNLVVPLPPPDPAHWENWLFLDSRDEWHLGDGVRFTYSGRLNFRAADSLPFPDHENVRNDLREAYVTWQPSDGTWLELGRINLKSGVALGYNPTDFFKTRAVVEPLTADPSVLREDRLGTLMLLGQHIWEGGSITAAFAPRVTLPTAVYRNTALPSFDPMLDRTNAQDRFLLKGSVNITHGRRAGAAAVSRRRPHPGRRQHDDRHRPADRGLCRVGRRRARRPDHRRAELRPRDRHAATRRTVGDPGRCGAAFPERSRAGCVVDAGRTPS